MACQDRPPLAFDRTDQAQVRLGEPLLAILDRSPRVSFVPYAGWGEELPSDSLFSYVSYEISRLSGGFGGRPGRFDRYRRVRSVVYGGRGAESADSVLRLAIAQLGAPDSVGCYAAGNARHIAVWLWYPESQVVDLRILVSPKDSSFAGPPVLQVSEAPGKGPPWTPMDSCIWGDSSRN